MFTKVLEVNDVHLTIFKTNPLTLRIAATGLVPTAGYSDAELAAWIYVQPPQDGICSFDFFARQPSGGYTAQPVCAISAVVDIQLDEIIRGVRVFSTTNDIVVMLNQAATKELQGKIQLAGVMPWPGLSQL